MIIEAAEQRPWHDDLILNYGFIVETMDSAFLQEGFVSDIGSISKLEARPNTPQ